MAMKFGILFAAAALLASAAPLSAAPVKLTMWTQDRSGVTGALVDEFNKSQDKIEVELADRDFSSLVSDLTRAFATGNAPDIVEVDNPELSVFSSRNLLLDLTDRAAKAKNFDVAKMLPGMRDAGTWKGHLYGIPKAANTIALYYNADMFRKKGLDPDKPPKTWDELAKAAAVLNDPAAKVSGLGLSAAANEEGTFQFLPFVQMKGANYDNLNSPGAIDALTFWSTLYRSGNVIPDAISAGQWDLTAVFNAGGTAMTISGPWELKRMSETAKFEWRVALLPTPDVQSPRSSALGEFMHGINAKTAHPDEAFAAIDWFHSRDNQLWNRFGYIPGFQVDFQPERFADAYAVFAEQIKYARVRGPEPQWPKISKAIQTAIQDSLTGQTDPTTALKTAAATISTVLGK